MKKIFIVASFFCCTAHYTTAQPNRSSNLPIIVINTNGVPIPNEPKIEATMGIIYNGPGERNNLTDSFNEYNGNIGIEVRGQSSQMFPMKSYSIELRDENQEDTDASLFGLPEESDWVLYAPYTDKTLMRNYLAYDLSNQMGHWAAHCRYVEVILNERYVGIYVLMEKIKRDKNRVNIKKLEPQDSTSDKISGGYIFSLDKEPDAWYSKYAAPNSFARVRFKYEYPKVEDITQIQKDYIKRYTDSFEAALKGENFQDPLIGFRQFADENSFIDYFIVNELSRNVDGYHISTYMYKDRDDVNKKIHMGPVWDYDLAFRNANYCRGSDTTGWAYRNNYVCPPLLLPIPFWWDRLFQDTAFQSNLLCRWKSLRQNILSTASLYATIDSIAALTSEARQRHFTKWPVLGVYVWPNPNPIPETYTEEIRTLKFWIAQRLAWIDRNLPQLGACVNTQVFAEPSTSAVVNEVPVNTFKLSPNPGRSHFVLTGGNTNESITIQVFSAEGNQLLQYNGMMAVVNEQLNKLLANQTSGIYMLSIQQGNHRQTIKVVVQ